MTKQDWYEDVVSLLPADTADFDYLINVDLFKLSKRGLAALADALKLMSERKP